MHYLKCVIFQIFENFHTIFLLLISILIPLLSENVFCMTVILLNVRCSIWPRMCPGVIQKCVIQLQYIFPNIFVVI